MFTNTLTKLFPVLFYGACLCVHGGSVVCHICACLGVVTSAQLIVFTDTRCKSSVRVHACLGLP